MYGTMHPAQRLFTVSVAGLCLLAGCAVGQETSGGRGSTPTTPPTSAPVTSGPEDPKAPPTAFGRLHLDEDSLPPLLTEWGGDIRNLGEVDGHPGCWASVADTTVMLCEDGWATMS